MPNDSDRILELERELIATRNAAVALILGMAGAIVRTPQGREELAVTFDEAAKDGDSATERLSKLVAAALRRG